MRKLYVAKWNNHCISAIIENNKPVELFVYAGNDEERIGDIYLGIVNKFLPKLHSYFIDLGENKEGFLPASEVTHELSPGERVIVQIVNLRNRTKSSKLTTSLAFPGRLLVYLPNANYVAASKKIPEAMRDKWITYGYELVENDEGIIFRTAVLSASQSSVRKEFEQLRTVAKSALQGNEHSQKPTKLYQGLDSIEQIFHDYPDITEIVTNHRELFNTLEKTLSTSTLLHVSLTLDNHVSFNLDREIELALKKVVWLPNASNLLIEETEVATIIDVNSAKSRDSILNINLEAAREIARQIRLRNLSGMIIIDFIRMEFAEEQEMVKNEFKRAVRHDKKTITLFGFTPMGLFELTRKKSGPSLKQSLCEH